MIAETRKRFVFDDSPLRIPAPGWSNAAAGFGHMRRNRCGSLLASWRSCLWQASRKR
ncbi:hypothetical protein SBA3_1000003 [Candidatus Sulfopaludibacter sp. SbA3]|nr:hypothetical protein SBA3_1000003 [Candidatus Sulfopaludibacter sp. SbA3]